MQWKDRRTSSHVEDRRGSGGKTIVGGGICGLILLLVITFLGGNPTDIMNELESLPNQSPPPYEEADREAELAQFVSVVLADTEVWSHIFQKEGLTYENPTLVLYSNSVQSACGTASSEVGPFYCPGDRKLYIDLSFYDELQNKFQAPGDFAMAYVIAREVGHHVQTLLGTSDQIMPLRHKLSEREFNKYLVRFELQADYYAGVWAHHEKNLGLLDEGDIDEALRAASAVGDDAIQKQARGYFVPDSFTHGTSEQRKHWFNKGYVAGNLKEGDMFASME